MKTREELVTERRLLMRFVNTFRVVKTAQLYKFLEHKGFQIQKQVIHSLVRENRIFMYDEFASNTEKWSKFHDYNLIRAIWIMIDFPEEITYYNTEEYPKKIQFITPQSVYKIVTVDKGMEMTVNHILHSDNDSTVKYIVVVDAEEQIDMIEFPGIICFCTVSEDGNVNYYQE